MSRATPRPARGAPGVRRRADDSARPANRSVRAWLRRALEFLRWVSGWARVQLIELVESQPAAVALAVYGFFRAMGITVRTGQQGLMFRFGRATRVLEPGFHLMVPFLMQARVVPNRSRTLDLEDQQVATFDGLVYRVHATLVWRIVDVRLALVEIDDLLLGMRNALATSVWEVLERRERESVRASVDLDRELADRMQQRLEPWGVVVERAGFQSIAPIGATLALLQQRQRVAERERVARGLANGLLAGGSTVGEGRAGRRGLPSGAALGLVGTPHFPVRRQRRALARSAEARRARLLRRQARRARAAARGAVQVVGRPSARRA